MPEQQATERDRIESEKDVFEFLSSFCMSVCAVACIAMMMPLFQTPPLSRMLEKVRVVPIDLDFFVLLVVASASPLSPEFQLANRDCPPAKSFPGQLRACANDVHFNP